MTWATTFLKAAAMKCTCGHRREDHSRFGVGGLWCFIFGCSCTDYRSN